MGESACLMHSFSYDSSGIPNESKDQGNHVPALGESVSFGRFTSESLAWEKWSTFSHKRYVEEAKSYAQPGSVAQKKAFFEAHYKKIAAQKAAAAALLEEQKAATTSSKSHDDSPSRKLNSHDLPIVLKSETAGNEEQQIITHDGNKHNSTVKLVGLEIDKVVEAANCKNTESSNESSVSVDSRKSQMERPLLKSKSNNDQEVTQPMIKRKPAISSLMSIGKKPSRIPSSPPKYVASVRHRKDNVVTPRAKISTTMDYIDKRRSNPKSLDTLMKSSSVKEPCKLTFPAVRKIENSKPPSNVRTTPKRSATPMKTPTKAFVNGVNKQPLATPSSVHKRAETSLRFLAAGRAETPLRPSAVGRAETPLHPSAVGSKTAGPKWHILSAVSKSLSAYRNKLQSPTISSPFNLRTEERAARRKQKLEEKFNEKEVQKLQMETKLKKLEEKFNEKAAQKVQLQTKLKEKAETEFRRLRQTFCFKARPLPDFYKGRETPKSQIKTEETNPKPFPPARKLPSTSSHPTSASSTKNKSSRRLWKTNDQNPTQHPLFSLAKMVSQENTSPNIQY